MKELETSRLHLRLFSREDLHALQQILGDEDVLRYIGTGGAENLESAEKTIKIILSHWEKHGFGLWAVEEKSGGNLIGWCGLQFMDKTPEVEAAYLLDKPYWGRGLASEAARAAIGFGFNELNLERIVAIAHPNNVASSRVMEKIGMKYEREAHFYGINVVYYAIKREEFSGDGPR